MQSVIEKTMNEHDILMSVAIKINQHQICLIYYGSKSQVNIELNEVFIILTLNIRPVVVSLDNETFSLVNKSQQRLHLCYVDVVDCLGLLLAAAD